MLTYELFEQIKFENTQERPHSQNKSIPKIINAAIMKHSASKALKKEMQASKALKDCLITYN